jgi:TnpA family transposase
MIYWHVERKSLCIHSQLKSPSSSEVASMIEGVIRHCTEMEVDRQYVDSHGQSTVAFAFCRLLNFQLMPRLKAIHAQKLYRPEAGQPDAYSHLQLVLDEADRLGTGPPAIRPDGQIHDGAPAWHGRDGSHPTPLHPQ